MFRRWKSVDTQIHHVLQICRRWLHSQTVAITAYTIILFIALFGPLVCIIHCHLLPVLPTSNTTTTTSAYFCQILAASVVDESRPSATSQLPNSIHPLPLETILSLFVFLLLCARGIPTISHTPLQIILLTPTPPPRQTG